MLENFGNIEKFSSDTLDNNYDYNNITKYLEEKKHAKSKIL